MNLDTQIEQTKIALQILEGRKQGAEPEWEKQIQVAWNGQVAWITGQPHHHPLNNVTSGIPIRLKPATLPPGFIPHTTMESPVPWETLVEVCFKDGAPPMQGKAAHWAWNAKNHITGYRVIQESNPLPPGFLPWSGGECPVAGDTMVEVIFRDKSADITRQASNWEWHHARADFDIIAYRVIEPEKPRQRGPFDHMKTTFSQPEPDPYAELRAAHAAGKVIQWYNGAIWQDKVGEFWNLSPDRYRIKPSEPQQPSIKLGDWIRKGDKAWLVLGTQPGHVLVGCSWLDDIFSSEYQISRDQGATWEPINKTHV